MTESNGVLRWADLVRTLGFPVVVALIMLGVFLGLIPSPITKMEQRLVQHDNTATRNTYLLRLICQRLSATDTERWQCLRDFPTEGIRE